AKPADSSVNVEIPIAQLDSFVPELDTHLKGKDFFDAEQFPTATFTSTRVIAKGKNQFEVRGTLTLRGVSKPVVLNAVLNKRGL
ncbi:YceI family protein, partial [Klebsiella pneumoniae]|nr:YceI family protein [Klebsiella pneumoniae]